MQLAASGNLRQTGPSRIVENCPHADLTLTMPPPTRTRAYDQLESLLADRILILDGAMGTMVQALHLTEADYRSERFLSHHRT
jgi:hypothetical protein